MKNILIALFLSSLYSCSKQIYVANEEVSYSRVDNKLKERSSNIDALIAPYKVSLDSVMNEVIAYSPQELVKKKPNSSLGNWFSDVIKDAGIEALSDQEIDVSLQNYGGLRISSIAEGEITVGKIYELMPFDNQLVVLTLDSSEMQQLYDRVADYGGWPISGSTFTIKNKRAKDIQIQGKPLSNTRTYQVGLSDYIANGGDNCFFLKELPRVTPGILIRDLIIDYLVNRKIKTISVDNSERINITGNE